MSKKSNYLKRLQKVENRFSLMRQYLLLKVDEEDWHGVADAAMDIREIIIELEYLKELTEG